MPSSDETAEQTVVAYHWVMTVQTQDGRQGTSDGVIDVTPAIHTHESTYTNVLRAVKQWVGADNVTVLYFTVVPNRF